MHIYQFSLKKTSPGLFNSNNWIIASYRYFNKSDIEEIFIVRHHNAIDIFAVGADIKTVEISLATYFGKHLDNKVEISPESRDNDASLRYFFEILIGKNKGLPADPGMLTKIREEFNIALNEGAVGSVLIKMYRQGENIGDMLQSDPVIKKNCIARPEVLFDISEKIAGNLDRFQFIYLGSQTSGIKQIADSIKYLEIQNTYIFHENFAKAYQAGIELGCIPLNKVQLENHLNENTIVIDFENAGKKSMNMIIQAAKNNKNLIYIYFDLINNTVGDQISYPPNFYIQFNKQIIGLINNHIQNRKNYINSLDPLISEEIKKFYLWLYSDDRFVFSSIVSADRRMQKVFELLRRIAPSDISVLISGETGTGKELIARAIHQNSMRSQARFVAVNCSAIPDTLLEGELFGYEKGAFTGAISAKKGLIEIASGGTLFLDEIGDLPPMIQVKLLRVLQEREILPIGSTNPVKVDIRLVTATNHDIDELVEIGKFRSDLYYRVNTVQIKLPALRERSDDIPILTDYFIKRLNRSNGKQISKISADVYKRFISYDWPGNIRELENIIERAFAVSIGEEITVTDLPTRMQSYPATKPRIEGQKISLDGSLKQNEAERIRDLIIHKKLNLTKTAKILGIGRTTLWRKMREFGISRDSFEG
jgi:transcriptional regulator with PAS, ATPase and Fis domain